VFVHDSQNPIPIKLKDLCRTAKKRLLSYSTAVAPRPAGLKRVRVRGDGHVRSYNLNTNASKLAHPADGREPRQLAALGPASEHDHLSGVQIFEPTFRVSRQNAPEFVDFLN
jgi:hypothetical protein